MSIIKTESFKILLASENLTFRNNLGSKLRVEGFDAEIVDGGFHLLHLIERHRDYQMIIINDDMKDMSGHEIIQLVRVFKNKTDLPILYISKNESEDEICHMVFAGANEYIIQSPTYKQIIDSVHRYFIQYKANAA